VAWAAGTGPATAKLAEAVLAARRHPEQGFRSCLGIVRLGERYRAALGIIRLAGRHGAERAEAACARALRLRSCSYRSVESILRTGLDRQPLPGDAPALAPHPAHDNVRGPGYYH